VSNPSQDQPMFNPMFNPPPGFEHPYPPAGQEHLTEQQQWTGPQPKRPRVKDKRFGWLVLIVVFVIGCALGYAVGSSPVEQESGAFTQDTGYHSAEPGDDADRGQGSSTLPEASGSATAAPAEPKPTPTLTRAQKEAVEAAESYLDSGHFSKQGLLDQLKSEYGEGFTKKDAQFAIDHVKADYKAEAVEAAESYLDSGHFSKAELLDQLESKYGEGFTHAEATYAVDKVY